MSSCPFSDLVVVFLVAAVVAVLLRHVLACPRRSMHQGLHGWNKSSSMLRDGFGMKYSGFLHIRPCGFCRGDCRIRSIRTRLLHAREKQAWGR